MTSHDDRGNHRPTHDGGRPTITGRRRFDVILLALLLAYLLASAHRLAVYY